MVGNGECPGRIKKGAAEASDDLRGLRVSAPRDLHQMRLHSKGQDVVECGKVPDWQMVGFLTPFPKPSLFNTVSKTITF
jgi:hypothetical protein